MGRWVDRSLNWCVRLRFDCSTLNRPLEKTKDSRDLPLGGLIKTERQKKNRMEELENDGEYRKDKERKTFLISR